MMKKLLCVSILLLGAVAASAQGSNGGVLYASDFANWSLPQANTPAFGQIQWTSSQICQVSATGYTFTGPKTGRPVRIVDANSSLSETVTPTNVIVNGGFCSLTASMANAHYTYHVGSGTAGLQEAIDYQSGLAQGSVVVLTPAWTLAGGTTGMITAASGNANVSILDERTNTFTAYSWNGSAYVVSPFISTGCLGGNSVANGCTGATAQPTAFNNIVGPGGAMTGPLSTPAITATQEQVNGPAVKGALCSYGDSITALLAASSQSNVWEFWLGRAFGFTTYDFGVGSQTSWTSDQFIFNSTCPPIGPKQLVTHMLGTNNVGLVDPLFPTGFSPDGVSNYQISIEAQYAWLGLGASPAIKFGNSSGITYVGSWLASSQIPHDPGMQCTGLTCSATFHGTGTTLYLATAAINGGSATGTLTCDGTPTGATLNFFPINSYNTASNFVALTRVTGLSNTAHSCTVQNTSAGLIALEWAQFLAGSNPVAAAPVVLAESILDRSTANFPVDVTTPAYRAVQGPSVALLVGDGLTNLNYQNNTGILNPQDYSTDGLHPLDHAHWLIAQNSIAILNSVYGMSQVMPSYSYNYVSNNALYGSLNFCVGSECLASLPNSSSAGSGNQGFGPQVLKSLTTGQGNTAGGEVSQKFNIDGIGNTSWGSKTIVFNAHGSLITAGGYHTLENALAGPNDGIGALACGAVTTGTGNLCVAENSGSSNTTHSFTFNLGLNAGQNNQQDNNWFAGIDAGQFNVDGSLLTLGGFEAGQNGVHATAITALGYKCAIGNVSGSSITCMGAANLELSTTAGDIVSIGSSTMQNATGTIDGTIAAGDNVFRNLTNGPNIGIGDQLGTLMTNAVGNDLIGDGGFPVATTPQFDAGLGYKIGFTCTTCSFNWFGGALSGLTLTQANGVTTSDHLTLTGYDTGLSSPTQVSNSFAYGNGAHISASNQGVWGNSSVTSIFAGGLTASAIIHSANFPLAAGSPITFVATGGVSSPAAGSTTYSGLGGIGSTATIGNVAPFIPPVPAILTAVNFYTSVGATKGAVADNVQCSLWDSDAGAIVSGATASVPTTQATNPVTVSGLSTTMPATHHYYAKCVMPGSWTTQPTSVEAMAQAFVQ